MAVRTTWQVELGGGIQTFYNVVAVNPNGAAQQGWKLDELHQDHGKRTSILVTLTGQFTDDVNTIPDNVEDQLIASVAALTTSVNSLGVRLSAVESKTSRL